MAKTRLSASEHGGRVTSDPFWVEEDELPTGLIRIRCSHWHLTRHKSGGEDWAGPWRSTPEQLRADEDGHACDRAVRWREQRAEDPRVAA